jgi:hypothetical protein
MSDATSVLFGLEDEFSVLQVQRVDTTAVKVIIEQTAREGPCPACGVFTGTVKDRPVMRLKESARVWSNRRAVVAEASAGLCRAVVSAEVVHPDVGRGAAAGAGYRAAAAAGRDRDRVEQSGRLRRRCRVRGVVADRAQGAGRGGREMAAGAGADNSVGHR